MKKFLVLSCIIIFIAVAVIMIFDIYLLLQGSLEMFPTAEQQEKAMLGYGLLLIPLIAIECLLFFLIKKFHKR